jgi:hypothetical protein
VKIGIIFNCKRSFEIKHLYLLSVLISNILITYIINIRIDILK